MSNYYIYICIDNNKITAQGIKSQEKFAKFVEIICIFVMLHFYKNSPQIICGLVALILIVKSVIVFVVVLIFVIVILVLVLLILLVILIVIVISVLIVIH